MKPILLTMLSIFPAVAQAPLASVSGPGLGVVFDAATGKIRLLAGIPASATAGEPLDAGVTLSRAVPAAGQSYAIGTEEGTGASVLVSATGRSELPGVKSGAARIAISPRGRAAAFYFEDTGSVQIVAGLPDHPRVVREVSPGGALSALAVSDDAEVLLAAVGEGVVEDQAGTGFRLLQRASGVIAMEFIPDSRNALYAESAANAVWMIAGSQVTPLMDERDGIADAVAVAASGDGGRILVAMRSGKVAIRDARSGEMALVSCSCEPDGLARLRGSAAFRLNGFGDGPVWILDASGEQPRIVFVAAAARSEQ